ncbi:MAG: Ig-like domain-containing protein, partial [Candidatus Diapherotrites archaeon]|nr:Ig-like domain-containing protein [Candidatus Diapherotrites archaeon]
NYSAESIQADANSWRAVATPADTTEPTLDWEAPTNNSTVTGNVVLRASAYDDESGIKQVKFYVDDSIVGTVSTSVGTAYSFDWNSMTVSDGTHTLKAIALSWSGSETYNHSAQTISVRTNNGITAPAATPQDETDANAAIDAAKAKKTDAESFIAQMNRLAATPSEEVKADLDEAKALLQEAEDLFNDGNYDAAREKADAAEEILGDLLNKVAIAPAPYKGEQQYEYSSEKLDLFLQATGLQQPLIEDAKAALQDVEVGRSVAVWKITDVNGDYYKAVVKVTLKNKSDSSKSIVVVEVVPKQFAENASLLGGSSFEVVMADPVIKWTIELAAGEEQEVNYGLLSNLSQEEADQLLESEPMQLFVAPPIALSGGTAVDAASFGLGQAGVGMSLEEIAVWIGWAVLALVIAAGAFFGYNYFARGKGGKSIYAMLGAKKSGEPPAQEEKKPEEQQQRWEHKEESEGAGASSSEPPKLGM